MFETYRRALSTRGAPSFTLAGAIGRLPASMTGLGIILIVQERTGSYSTAGAIAAAYILTSAVSGPLQGKFADRFGQFKVLIGASILFVIGLVLFLALALGTTWASFLAVMVAGAGAPQTGNMVRTRWSHAVDNRDVLNTAFALEAVLDEAVFAIGPVVVTFLTLNILDISGLAVAGACAVVGGWGLAFQRATEPPATPKAERGKGSVAWRFLVPIVIAAICVGVVFGSTEVLIVAFTDERGQKQFAGWVLASNSVAALISGLVIGSRTQVGHPATRLRVTTLALTASLVPLPFVGSTLLLLGCMFLMGLTIAPTLIAAVSLVEHIADISRLTEALTWTTTGLSAGVALGAGLSGRLVEHYSVSAGMALPVVAAGFAAIVARLSPTPPPMTLTKKV